MAMKLFTEAQAYRAAVKRAGYKLKVYTHAAQIEPNVWQEVFVERALNKQGLICGESLLVSVGLLHNYSAMLWVREKATEAKLLKAARAEGKRFKALHGLV